MPKFCWFCSGAAHFNSIFISGKCSKVETAVSALNLLVRYVFFFNLFSSHNDHIFISINALISDSNILYTEKKQNLFIFKHRF